jgi:hypothetical protein
MDIWSIGFIVIVVARVFYAGMNYDNIVKPRNGISDPFIRLFEYGLTTVGVALAWPVAVPLYVVFKIGQRFKKES